MDNLNNIDQKMTEYLNEYNEEKLTELKHLEKVIEKSETIQKHFHKHTKDIYLQVVEPRLKLLASKFDDAEYSISPSQHSGVVFLNLKRKVDASIEIHLGFHLNHLHTQAELVYDFHCIPILMDFKKQDLINLEIENIDQNAVAEFSDKSILTALKSFIGILNNKRYQKINIVIDPVCYRKISKVDAVAVETDNDQKHKYYFCTEHCHQQFILHKKKYMRLLHPLGQ